jgi:hypothetical protein
MVPDSPTEWRFLAKPCKLDEMARELRNLLVARPESWDCALFAIGLEDLPGSQRVLVLYPAPHPPCGMAEFLTKR